VLALRAFHCRLASFRAAHRARAVLIGQIASPPRPRTPTHSDRDAILQPGSGCMWMAPSCDSSNNDHPTALRCRGAGAVHHTKSGRLPSTSERIAARHLRDSIADRPPCLNFWGDRDVPAKITDYVCC
jgi:hypothetical protein